MKLTEKILKSYPEATDISIAEIFTPNKGWVQCLSCPLVNHTLEFLAETNVTHVNLKLTDEFGVIRRPDYSIKELLIN